MTDVIRTEDPNDLPYRLIKLGDGTWEMQVDGGPFVQFTDRNIANQVFQAVHNIYQRGQRDAFRDLRRFIGVD